MAKSDPSLADLARASVGVKGPRTDVDKLAAVLKRDDPRLYAEFVAAINDRYGVPAAGLSRALEARGYRIAEQSISRYRKLGRTL